MLQLACLLLCIGALPCSAESETMNQWKRQIASQLQARQYFPFEAYGKDRPAIVALTIDRRGKLLSSNIVSETGFQALDKAALKIVESAQPFPSAPREATDDQLEVVVELVFKPDGAMSDEAVRDAERLRSVMQSLCRGC